MRESLAAVVLGTAFLAACGGGGSGTSLGEGPQAAGFAFSPESAVSEGQAIDSRYTCDGEDVSPALSWVGVPESARELALVLEDPDAPGRTFTHWIVYALGVSTTSLPEGVPGGAEVDAPSLRQGKNDFGKTAYRGPCPPGKTHRYVFRLLALDAAPGLEPGVGRRAFDQAVEGHVLAEARLEATYGR
jgi:Raf kinase inhibitor-like YbhB/YbcL family protein